MDIAAAIPLQALIENHAALKSRLNGISDSKFIDEVLIGMIGSKSAKRRRLIELKDYQGK